MDEELGGRAQVNVGLTGDGRLGLVQSDPIAKPKTRKWLSEAETKMGKVGERGGKEVEKTLHKELRGIR